MIRLLLTMLLVLPALPVCADEMDNIFGKGRSQFSLVGASAHAFGNSYFVLGGSAGYYVADGLGVGLSLEKWSTDGPGMTKYAPFVQYVFYKEYMVPLYVSGFYSHAAIEGLPGIDSLGARAGVLLAASPTSFFGVSLVYESYLNCQVPIYRVCRETYPDFSFIVGF